MASTSRAKLPSSSFCSRSMLTFLWSTAMRLAADLIFSMGETTNTCVTLPISKLTMTTANSVTKKVSHAIVNNDDCSGSAGCRTVTFQFQGLNSEQANNTSAPFTLDSPNATRRLAIVALLAFSTFRTILLLAVLNITVSVLLSLIAKWRSVVC